MQHGSAVVLVRYCVEDSEVVGRSLVRGRALVAKVLNSILDDGLFFTFRYCLV